MLLGYCSGPVGRGIETSFPVIKISNITTWKKYYWFIYRVEGAIRYGLDSPVEESDEETCETAPDGYQTTVVSEQRWNLM